MSNYLPIISSIITGLLILSAMALTHWVIWRWQRPNTKVRLEEPVIPETEPEEEGEIDNVEDLDDIL